MITIVGARFSSGSCDDHQVLIGDEEAVIESWADTEVVVTTTSQEQKNTQLKERGTIVRTLDYLF